MAGYSGTPLSKKLGIKAGARVALVGAPTGFVATLEPLPEDARVVRALRAPVDVAMLFCKRAADLERGFARCATLLTPAGGLWVAWPKRSSGIATDLSEAAVREYGLGAGLVDNKVCAVDDTWSALRFVVRVRDRVAR